MIRFKCPGCDTTLSAKDALAGKNTKCPKCSTSVAVPAGAGTAASTFQQPQKPSISQSAVPRDAAGDQRLAASAASTLPECPSCRARLKLDVVRFTGKKVRCPKCGTVFAVQAPPPVEDESNQAHTLGPSTWLKASRAFSRFLAPLRNDKSSAIIASRAEKGATTSPPPNGPAHQPDQRNCGHCKHRLPRKMCGQRKSEYYHQSIALVHVCSCFEVSDAAVCYSDAQVEIVAGQMTGKEDSLETATKLLQQAIRLGLPEDDEVNARLHLAIQYKDRGERLIPKGANFVYPGDFAEAFAELETAVRTDSARGYGVFQSHLVPAILLEHFDLIYALVSRSIKQTKDADAAIAFLEERLSLFQCVPDDPMLQILLDLGGLYFGRGDRKQARTCWDRVLHAQPIRGCEKRQAELRDVADQCLTVLDG
jgi:predicted Zn finger-like uncharacterized protein